ncbi:MAG: hypothetical protein LBI69_05020 [Puniceicoccales bacterium]|nr:hypothetical protein [Puniceicoccales bacterium]
MVNPQSTSTSDHFSLELNPEKRPFDEDKLPGQVLPVMTPGTIRSGGVSTFYVALFAVLGAVIVGAPLLALMVFQIWAIAPFVVAIGIIVGLVAGAVISAMVMGHKEKLANAQSRDAWGMAAKECPTGIASQ